MKKRQDRPPDMNQTPAPSKNSTCTTLARWMNARQGAILKTPKIVGGDEFRPGGFWGGPKTGTPYGSHRLDKIFQ